MAATYADYLTKLTELRDNLAAYLTQQGVSASNTETLQELVPKVLDIAAGAPESV